MSTRSAFLAAGVAIAAAIFLLRPASDLSRPGDLGEAVADMILANATIYTADPAMPFAEAMAELKGRHTMELNLSGNVVLPGFIDSHVHFIDGGLQVWLSRMDGHMGIANSLAMRMAGIDKNTNNPVGGTIMRTTEGEPTGLLVDAAMKLVFDVISEVSIHERRDALLRASRHALMRGVTTVVDVGSYFPGKSEKQVWQDFTDIYEWAHSVETMIMRVCLFFPMPTWSRVYDLIHEKGRMLSQWIHLGGVKAFLDGSLGSSSALFYEHYKDDPRSYGLQLVDMDYLLNTTLELDKSGLQIAIHAIGDKANDMLLDMYEKVVDLNGMKDHRFRIEHAQHLAPGAAKRFGKHGIIASVQPDHILDDANSAGKKIGIERAERSSYSFRSLLDGGAHLAFGSDWPVSDINPLQAIRTAVSRKPAGWEVPWIPAERLSLDDSLKAHTISAAYACFLDHVLGSLSEGKYADFVILPSTSWNEFGSDIPDHVLATYVNGKQAYP
uniref:Amidohydrolase 3 domain-containing protein n=1 Tax=Oryza rufipogon TaxID=4529 RepID=A0A0E0N7P8_ORYRU